MKAKFEELSAKVSDRLEKAQDGGHRSPPAVPVPVLTAMHELGHRHDKRIAQRAKGGETYPVMDSRFSAFGIGNESILGHHAGYMSGKGSDSAVSSHMVRIVQTHPGSPLTFYHSSMADGAQKNHGPFDEAGIVAHLHKQESE